MTATILAIGAARADKDGVTRRVSLPTVSYFTSGSAGGNFANIGIGPGAVDFGGAYTYLNMTSGFEFSAAAGMSFNF